MSEYLHAALLLHAAKKEISEENLKNVVKAAGVEPDSQRVKMLVSALSGVDIDKILATATSAPLVAPTVGGQAGPSKAEKKPAEEPKEEKKEEMAGLGALFQ